MLIRILSWFLSIEAVLATSELGALAQHPLYATRSEIQIALLSHGVRLQELPHLGDGSSKTPDCHHACETLTTLFGSRVISQDDVDRYRDFTQSYWSNQQAEVLPACIFQPGSAGEVAVHVLVSRLASCPFAVKGGGHASFAGGSSIGGGITVSLELLNDTHVPDADRSIASVGAGSRWGDVYAALERHHLTVVGGRDADVGVGGLTLGGGMSFFSNMHGWACDNVAAYEVVLASGAIVLATPSRHADLYWALRGGGNNFGIVTRFHFATLPLPDGLVWGGAKAMFDDRYDPEALLDAFFNMGSGMGAGGDGKASQILSFLYSAAGAAAESLIPNVALFYAEPEYFSAFGEENPPYEFVNRDLVGVARGFSEGQPPGRRDAYWTLTFKLAKLRGFMKEVALNVFHTEMRRTAADITGLWPVLMCQTIGTETLKNMRKNGGNPFGLEGEEPRVLVTVVMSWDDAADDERVHELCQGIIEHMKTAADALGCGCRDDFIYMNYASQGQEVIDSYGIGNKERLLMVADRYDPNGVFQTLQPGYHKLRAR
ncbi:FAD-binding domain-containing protein [Xylariomycetidae sp. FL2044]|nr:FAD-binding domain-containing protein [Xylariomycetidae sp. FL2044]